MTYSPIPDFLRKPRPSPVRTEQITADQLRADPPGAPKPVTADQVRAGTNHHNPLSTPESQASMAMIKAHSEAAAIYRRVGAELRELRQVEAEARASDRRWNETIGKQRRTMATKTTVAAGFGVLFCALIAGSVMRFDLLIPFVLVAFAAGWGTGLYFAIEGGLTGTRLTWWKR